MPSVVFTPAQMRQIAVYFAQKQFVEPNATAICAIDHLQSAISTLAMSISIGGGTVAYSPAFSPPVSNMTTAQQSALISYILMQAMGVPLV